MPIRYTVYAPCLNRQQDILVPGSLGALDAGTMLFTAETTDEGQVRVTCTYPASVMTYFTEDGEGGVTLHASASDIACPWSTTAAKIEAVRVAVLEEAARRLACAPVEVIRHPLDALVRVSDPHLKHRPTWTGRGRTLRRPAR